MLQEFIAVHRDEIIRRCRVKVATMAVPRPTTAQIDQGVPVFLDQLIRELGHGASNSNEIGRSAAQHGDFLWRQGFTVGQVVHAYGDVCQAITDLAVELAASISTDDFRTLNRCLDDAIASAVTGFIRESDHPVGIAVSELDRFGALARVLGDAIGNATIALDAVASGHVGVGGSTGTVLQQSLAGARDLVEQLSTNIDAARWRLTIVGAGGWQV
jgi:hypothetical protein